jgi:hypothetical protein
MNYEKKGKMAMDTSAFFAGSFFSADRLWQTGEK